MVSEQLVLGYVWKSGNLGLSYSLSVKKEPEDSKSFDKDKRKF